ncbi:MAG: hypothetical protein JRH17_16195 [Deltaproteobacteria bacterium]|nr:hypothetical protein [Deltaproteobacteria bacterium]
MKTLTRRHVIAAGALIAVALLLAPGLASAQMRMFTGRIDRVNKKKMIVDNRMGDKVSFVPIETTEVSGEGKTEWKDLKRKDWVTVHWKFVDKPRKAYKVEVLPPREDD